MEDDGTLVAASSISMRFTSPAGDDLTVLHDVSMSVKRGELVVITGRSGSGKTTLLRVLTGFLRPTAGSVHWAGQRLDFDDRSGSARRRAALMGIALEGASLLESLTASENVAIPAIPLGLDRVSHSRSLELLHKVGLVDRADHFPGRLSRGEQQRVAIARALFADPLLVVLDEPTASLDRRTSDGVIALLLDLRNDGRAVLAASHDPGLVAVADRLVELERSLPSSVPSRSSREAD